MSSLWKYDVDNIYIYCTAYYISSTDTVYVSKCIRFSKEAMKKTMFVGQSHKVIMSKYPRDVGHDKNKSQFIESESVNFNLQRLTFITAQEDIRIYDNTSVRTACQEMK